ncbi:hypothetical protein BC936DRAFT_140040 [Jimgerdemannia flammicorona]|uniref:Ser-Thr-rich glycosyl-phosphatidyl-inositol-anchored membrane family-domain-containing protein n=1 Tax=Jimgerdemannia flammicorona TaxID=994334 RepID=A0A433DH77_9FUNG|nr:hypothetical protein BC936DRAFT_140040 [Jimgerdemannia flammicorona]
MRAVLSGIVLAFILHTTFAIVYAPKIILPNSDSVWTVGHKELVQWNSTGIPKGTPGMIMIGYLNPGDINEHLNWTVAKGFDLYESHQSIVVPKDLNPGDNYIIVLFGDSGNASPTFTIKADYTRKRRDDRRRVKKSVA